jgi:hypothetical protein
MQNPCGTGPQQQTDLYTFFLSWEKDVMYLDGAIVDLTNVTWGLYRHINGPNTALNQEDTEKLRLTILQLGPTLTILNKIPDRIDYTAWNLGLIEGGELETLDFSKDVLRQLLHLV